MTPGPDALQVLEEWRYVEIFNPEEAASPVTNEIIPRIESVCVPAGDLPSRGTIVACHRLRAGLTLFQFQHELRIFGKDMVTGDLPLELGDALLDSFSKFWVA